MKRIYILLFFTFAALNLSAQSVIRTKHNWEFELKAGVNLLGGAAPTFMPVELRAIDGYAPKYGMALEGVAVKWFGSEYGAPEWGISLGLRVENRGMKTGAQVKSFVTKVPMGNETLEGYYTGKVSMEYRSTPISLPILANYRFNRDWKVRAGLYFGYELEGKFFSSVTTGGYLRTPTPIGGKMEFSEDVPYEFSDQLRKFQWGGQVGFSWRAYSHFHINTDLNIGFNNIFRKGFEGIPFKMHPIFLLIGFGYQF